MIKETTKALVRIDKNVKTNSQAIQITYEYLYLLIEKVDKLKKQVETLQKEVAKLKQAKK